MSPHRHRSTRVCVHQEHRCRRRWEPVTSSNASCAEADRVVVKEEKPRPVTKQTEAEQYHPIDYIVYDSPTNADSSESCHAPELPELPLVRFSSFQNALKVNSSGSRTQAYAHNRMPVQPARVCARTQTRMDRHTGGELRQCVADVGPVVRRGCPKLAPLIGAVRCRSGPGPCRRQLASDGLSGCSFRCPMVLTGAGQQAGGNANPRLCINI